MWEDLGDERRLARRVRELEAFGDRGSAGPREHRAAEYLLDQLRSVGLEADSEPFHGARSMASRLLVHVLVALGGAALLWTSGILTAFLGVVALLSLVAEQMTLGVWLSRPVCRHVSHNVVGRAPAVNPPRRRIVLCAHYDTQHGGWIWAINRLMMPLQAGLPAVLKQPLLLVVALMTAQVLLGAAELWKGPSTALSVAAGLLLASYAVLCVLLVQWALSRAVPGAADNASGVAAVLEIAGAWASARPADDVELVALLSGCEESGLLGAAAWADAHRRDLRAVPTVVVNVDGIGFGPPRFLGAEVPAAGVPLRAPPWLLQLCASTAREEGLTDPGPHTLPGPTDALSFHARRLDAVTVVGFAPGHRLPHYHTMADTADNADFPSAAAATKFVAALVRRLANPGQ